jgi:hypothetical protein
MDAVVIRSAAVDFWGLQHLPLDVPFLKDPGALQNDPKIGQRWIVRRTHGMVDWKAPCFRASLVGRWRNSDILVRI